MATRRGRTDAPIRERDPRTRPCRDAVARSLGLDGPRVVVLEGVVQRATDARGRWLARGRPWTVVAVVEPGRVRIHDGDRYETAREVATGGPLDGQLEERVPELVGPIEPLDTASLSPLTSDERSDPAAVATAYEDAYDALV